MKIQKLFGLAGIVLLLAACGGSGDSGDGGSGGGNNIVFCGQDDHYVWGDPSIGTITITRITGPNGATVNTSSMQGLWTVTGNYTFSADVTADISMEFGEGEAECKNSEMSISITKGSGQFTISCNRTAGDANKIGASMHNSGGGFIIWLDSLAKSCP